MVTGLGMDQQLVTSVSYPKPSISRPEHLKPDQCLALTKAEKKSKLLIVLTLSTLDLIYESISTVSPKRQVLEKFN